MARWAWDLDAKHAANVVGCLALLALILLVDIPVFGVRQVARLPSLVAVAVAAVGAGFFMAAWISAEGSAFGASTRASAARAARHPISWGALVACHGLVLLLLPARDAAALAAVAFSGLGLAAGILLRTGPRRG